MRTYQPGEEMMTNTSDESGISVNRPESPSDCDDIEEQSAEHLETGRREREQRRGGENEEEYTENTEDERQHLTIEEVGQRSQDKKEMSFSNRLGDRLGESGYQSHSRLAKSRENETTIKDGSKRKSWQSRPLSSS